MRSVRALLKCVLSSQVLWVHCRNRINLHPKLGSDVRTEIHTEGVKRFITYVMRLLGESRAGFPSWSENGLWEQGKETGVGFHCCWGAGAGHRAGAYLVWISCWSKVRAPMLSYQLSQWKVTWAGGKLNLSANIKSRVRFFITARFLWIPFYRGIKKIFHHFLF